MLPVLALNAEAKILGKVLTMIWKGPLGLKMDGVLVRVKRVAQQLCELGKI